MIDGGTRSSASSAGRGERGGVREARRAAVAGLVAASVLLAATPALSQEQSEGPSGEPLVTDRPDATESTETVVPGRLQLESGYTYQRVGDLRLHQVGEVLLRVGAVDRLEIRVGLESYLHEEVVGTTGPATTAVGMTAEGWGDTSVGLKWKLMDAGRAGSARPDVAVLASTTLPTGASAVSASAAQPEVRLATAWELPRGVGLGANLFYTWAEDTEREERFGELGSSVAVGVGLTDAVGAFVEHFGSYPLEEGLEAENFVNGGITLLLSPDAQLDARLGYGLNGRDDDVFVGLGSAFRW